VYLLSSSAFPHTATNHLAITQVESAYHFRRDEDVRWVLDKVALRVTEEAEAFSGDFNDASAGGELFWAGRG
jgi:hypothetical protein